MGISFTNEIIEGFKIMAIAFAVVHFLMGFILFTRFGAINRTIKTPNSGCLSIVAFIYLLVLGGIVLAVILV